MRQQHLNYLQAVQPTLIEAKNDNGQEELATTSQLFWQA
jgi:hypothetical protein